MKESIRFLIRGVAVVFAAAAAVVLYGGHVLLGRTRDQRSRERVRGEVLAELFISLGATYIKFGQILSTRPDLLGPGYIQALSRLQDQAPELPYSEMRDVLESELSREALGQIAHVEPKPVAAASVAQVHRATLVTGEDVAIKIQRPNAAHEIVQDILVMKVVAGWLDRVPSIRMLSLPGAVERFSEAMKGQLDFQLEATNNRRFAKCFEEKTGVFVPQLFPALCTRRVLTMEFVDGVRASEPERVGGDRSRLARTGFEVVLDMVFRYGFVHADMHPGNILLTQSGSLFLIDLGLVAEIPEDMKRPWIETFVALSQADGEGAARLFYMYAPTVGTVDYSGFEADVREHFKTFAGKTLGQVEASMVLGGMMHILRKHRVQVDPVFTVVNIALLVAEGLGKQLDDRLDFIEMAKPYIFEALATSPPGRTPRRQAPLAA